MTALGLAALVCGIAFHVVAYGSPNGSWAELTCEVTSWGLAICGIALLVVS